MSSIITSLIHCSIILSIVSAIFASSVTKWCLNEMCTETLFQTTIERLFNTSDSLFLRAELGTKVNVTAFMFSHRPDLMEGTTLDGKAGYIYAKHVDTKPLLEYLKMAIEKNLTHFAVSKEQREQPTLVRDMRVLKMLYKAKLEELKEEMNARGVDNSATVEIDKDNTIKLEVNQKNVENAQKETSQTPSAKQIDIAIKTASLPNQEKDTVTEPTKYKTVEVVTPPVDALKETIASKVEEKKISPSEEKLFDEKVQDNLKESAPTLDTEAVKANNADDQTNSAKKTKQIYNDESKEPIKPTKTEETNKNTELPPPSIKIKNVEQEDRIKDMEIALTKNMEQIDKTEPAQFVKTEANKNSESTLTNKNMESTPTIKTMEPETSTKNMEMELTKNVESVPTNKNMDPETSNKNMEMELTKNMESTPTIKTMEPENSTKNMEMELIKNVESTLTIKTMESTPTIKNMESTPTIKNMESTPTIKTIEPETNTKKIEIELTKNMEQTDKNTEPAQFAQREENNFENKKLPQQTNDVTQQPLFSSTQQTDEHLKSIIDDVISNSGSPPQNEKIFKEDKIPNSAIKLEIEHDKPSSINIEQYIDQIAQNKKDEEQPKQDIINSEIKAEEKEKSVAESEGYCIKESCNSISEQMNGKLFSVLSPASVHNTTFLPVVNAYIGNLRLLLPFPLNEFDNTGILIFAFLLIFLTLHVINASCSTDNSQKDVIDKRLLHDCMTRLKEQEVELAKCKVYATNSHQLVDARSVIEKLHTSNNELNNAKIKLEADRQKQENLLEEYEDKTKQIARKLQEKENFAQSKEREIENLKDRISGILARNTTISDELTAALNLVENLRHKNDSLQLENDELTSQHRDISEKLKNSENELVSVKEFNGELQSKVDKCMIIIDELQKKTDAHSSKSTSKRGKTDDLSKKSVASSDSSGNVIIETSNAFIAESELDNSMEPDDNGAGSGGSGAWSDFSEVDVIDGAKSALVEDVQNTGKVVSRKTSIGSTSVTLRSKGSSKVRAELFEIAELKSQIRSLESERDTLRSTVNVEQKEKDGLNQRIEQLKQDLAEKRREAEQRESERLALQSQCQKMLHMVEEKDNKSHEKEERLKQLHDQISQSEKELRKVEDEKRELASKVRELEHSFRKSEEMNSKLENKIYHEERRLNSKIVQLEEQLTKMHSLSPNASAMGDLNLSGNSSDREFPSKMPHDVPSLWSDVGSDLQYDALHDLDRLHVTGGTGGSGSMRHRGARKSLQALVAVGASGGELSSRGSPFELDEIWMNRANSTKEKRNSAANYRARSRSAGRQSVASGRQSARLVGVVPSPNSNPNVLFLQK